MKEVAVKYISDNIGENRIGKIADLLNTFYKYELSYLPWPEFPAKPKVSFAIAHQPDYIFLKFFVEEKSIRAVNNEINSAVNEDSCVEFFINFEDGNNYYNVEFNCIGTGLVGYGSSNNNRQLLDASLVKKIEKKITITSENDKGFHWQLTLIIPVSIFIHTSIDKLTGKNCRANFYKCGDLLPDPHFISWTNIVAEKPNFHLPDFFGKLVFEDI